MKVLGFDLETSSLDTGKARIIEIGAVVYETAGGMWTPEGGMSQLVFDLGDEALEQEIIDVTGITDELLLKEGRPLVEAITNLGRLIDGVDYIVAHNASFDRAVLTSVLDRHGLLRLVPGIQRMVETPWLCSKNDLRSNAKMKCMKLSHLALDYGVAVDPSELHRAINDVLLMGKMLQAAGADPQWMYEYQQMPAFFVGIEIPVPWKDGGKGKDEARKLGFSWQIAKGTDGPEFEKTWVKLVKECDLESLAQSSQYRIKTLRPL